MVSTSEKISKPVKSAAHKAAKDVKPDNSEDEQLILETINENSRLSPSFILLLLGSTVITALGLLLNDSAIVIGGMIISPLMWPLLKTAMSISYGYKRSIETTLILVIGSILLVFITSALLASVSPLKSTTSEIVARTSPSFFHIIIGLAGGGVATLAITKKRISTNLAGVAVATSLQPPLVTSAIGFALGEWEIFSKALILFTTNAISIIFIAALSFSLIGFRRSSGKELRNKGLIITAIALIVLAIPLISFLRSQSFESVAYQQVREQLHTELQNINPNITVENISTSFNENNPEILNVAAELWLPENYTFSYTEQRQLSRAIENAVNREVNLQLQLQRKISLISEQDAAYERVKDHLEELFTRKISADYPSLSVDNLSFSKDNRTWLIRAILRGNPATAPTIEELTAIQSHLSEQIGPPVELTIEVIPLVRLDTNSQRVETEITETTEQVLRTAGVTNSAITSITANYSPSPQTATVSAQINTASNSGETVATASAAREIQTAFTFPVFLEIIYFDPTNN